MRRLTLVLADLFLEAERIVDAGRVAEVERGRFSEGLVELPALQAALRIATLRGAVPDWREHLLRTIGVAPAGEAVWRAVPVQTEARLDHVRLADRGLVRLDASGASVLCESFNATFGPAYRLETLGHRDFVLHGGDWARGDVQTRDPATMLSRDIHDALPTGPQARALRKLNAEIEMWLHSHPWNVARQRAGQPVVTALWVHRTVAPQRIAGVGANASAKVSEDVALVIAADDSFSLELVAASGARTCVAHSWRELEAATADTREANPADLNVVAVQWPISDDGLERIDKDWVEPAVAALRARRLDCADFVANGVVFSLRAIDRWRWWRPRRHWLEALQLARAAAPRS
jgi:hypothetical protein